MLHSKIRPMRDWVRFASSLMVSSGLILANSASVQALVKFPNKNISHPSVASAPHNSVITLRVTVGTNADENACGASDEITVSQRAIVYFCYTATNIGTNTLNFHNVSDDIHGPLLVDFNYILRPGETVSLTHEMYVANAPVINNATWVGSITESGVEFPAVASNSAVVQVQGAPTVVQLSGFSAERTNAGMLIKWTTVREDDTSGFYVYRVEGRSNAPVIPGNATRITPQLVVAKGPNGGNYEVLDSSAEANKTYTYWLREIELGGTQNDYAMIGTRVQRVFLPVVLRANR